MIGAISQMARQKEVDTSIPMDGEEYELAQRCQAKDVGVFCTALKSIKKIPKAIEFQQSVQAKDRVIRYLDTN